MARAPRPVKLSRLEDIEREESRDTEDILDWELPTVSSVSDTIERKVSPPSIECFTREAQLQNVYQ